MDPTAAYLDHFAQVTADVVLATITARNDGGTYNIRTVSGRAEMPAAKNVASDEFAINSRVLVQMPGNSRTVLGAMPVILGRAPREQRGLSATTPDESSSTFGRSGVINFDPEPLILVRGGDSAEQTFIGYGFGSEPAEYLGHGEGVPPLLTVDDSGVTSTVVTMTISADEDSPLGLFDAVVSGVTVPNALKIVAAPVVVPMLWLLGRARPGDGATLWRLDPQTWAGTQVNLLDTNRPTDLVALVDRVVVKTGERAAVFERASGAPLGSTSDVSSTSGLQTMAVHDGAALYTDDGTDDILHVFAPEGLVESATITLGMPVPGDGAHVAVADGVAYIVGVARVVAFDLAAETILDTFFVDLPYAVAVDETNVYAAGFGGGAVHRVTKINRETGAMTEAFVSSDGPTANAGLRQLKTENGFVYGTANTTAGGLIFRLDPDTMDVTTVSTGSDEPAGLAVTASRIYVGFAAAGDFAGGALVVDADTMEILDRHEISTANEIQRVIFVGS